jgi:hypothetical protein
MHPINEKTSKMAADFKNSQAQRNWETALVRWERANKAVVPAERVGHEPSIVYWSNQVTELLGLYPALENVEVAV